MPRIRASDPGAYKLRVVDFYSEKPLEDVIEADTDRGVVLRYRRNTDGKFYDDPETGDVATEEVFRKIRIEQRTADGEGWEPYVDPQVEPDADMGHL